MKYTKLLTIILPAVIFLVVGIKTLPDYGINWDEPFHFNRGQAYLRFILTGKSDYLDLPRYKDLAGSSDFMGREGESDLYLNAKQSSIPPDPSVRRSYFESDVFDGAYFFAQDGYGHPPANDILAALTNYIFYQKLGIMGDIESHHLFEVVSVTALILGVAYFTCSIFGKFASLMTSVSLASYPLLFSESHFNIKDPPQAAFFGLSIIFLYFGVHRKKWYLLLLSAFWTGLALGTKFNIVFLPLIVAPWFLMHVLKNRNNFFREKRIILSLALYPAVTIAIFFTLWPYLWQNPLVHISQMLQFYKDVGAASTGELNSFIFKGVNLFAPFWILITTPLPVLIFALFGIIISIKSIIKRKKYVYLLILLWLLIPIVRVMLPGSVIHSGVRHIIEFVPALAIIAGIGAKELLKKLKITDPKIKFFLLLLYSLSLLLVLIKLHPNENVYFNELIGGLRGAVQRDVPYWGYSYGNVYLQGVNWINENAEARAKLGLAVVNMVNSPRIKLREDIDFSNEHLSGEAMKGEYVMEMSHNWGQKKLYSYAYYNTFLNPVYEVKVDEVAILKIWKNDRQYLKPQYKDAVEVEFANLKINQDKNILNIDIGKQISLTKLQITHDAQDCEKQKGGYIRLSSDQVNWTQETETIDYPQIPIKWLGSNKNTFVYLFTDKLARFIFLDTQMEKSCILQNAKIKVFGIKE
jgi:hypothetical protein